MGVKATPGHLSALLFKPSAAQSRGGPAPDPICRLTRRRAWAMRGTRPATGVPALSFAAHSNMIESRFRRHKEHEQVYVSNVAYASDVCFDTSRRLASDVNALHERHP